MDIPIRTTLAVAAFFALLLGMLGLLGWRTRRTYPGCARQTIANLLFALSFPLFTLRPFIPDWIGVVGANAIVVAATILSMEAIREYCGVRPRVAIVYASGILAVLAVIYFDYAVNDINARIFAISTFMGVAAMFSTVRLLWVWRAGRGLRVAVTGGMFAMSAMLLLARAIYFLLAPPLADLFEPSWINGALFAGCALSIACCSIGWTQLTHQRMLMDLKEEVESRTARANLQVAEANQRASSIAQRAAAVEAAKREFLETVNHEIRNPLASVMAATDLLLDTDLSLEQQECALSVRSSAQRLLKVNDDFLDLSKIETGEVVIESSVFDLRSVIEEVVKSYANVARRKQIDLVVAYSDGIPSGFCGDAGKIRQVMMNLVGNAIEFTLSGQVLVAVACDGQRPHDAQMRVSVTGNGIGAPLETIEFLFERSSQRSFWGSRMPGSAGIGLVVSKKVIELMGGRLHVESQVGTGSKFWFTLPLKFEDAC